MALVVDSGPLYAYADEDDRDHDACLELLETHPGPLLVPVLCVTEVTYLIESRLGSDAAVRVLGDFASGAFVAEPVDPSDWLRIAQLVHAYSDLPLGTVDASVVAASERLGAPTVATLDRRHFSVVRPEHTDGFEILP